jgi:hypothetical protein
MLFVVFCGTVETVRCSDAGKLLPHLRVLGQIALGHGIVDIGAFGERIGVPIMKCQHWKEI